MHSSEEKSRWVTQWRYEMAPTARRGIWKVRGGGYYVRVRATDPRTGKRIQRAAILRNLGVTMRDAIQAQASLRHEAHAHVEGTIPSLPLWSTYAALLFEAKVAEGKLSSAKSREAVGGCPEPSHPRVRSFPHRPAPPRTLAGVARSARALDP